jgi:hypothetical protein
MGGASGSWNLSIVGSMDSRFFNGTQPWTDADGGDGSTTFTRTYKGNEVTGPGIDCSHFVQQSMLTSGYN